MTRGKRDDEEQALTGHNGWTQSHDIRVIFSQDIYCGGYSGEDPPLPIPNREVKLAIADGTAPPGGRVGSCHFLIRVPDIERCRGLLRIRKRQRVQPPVLTTFGQPRGAPRPCPGRSLRDLDTACCSTSTRNLLVVRRLSVTAGFGEVFEMMVREL